MVLTNSPIWKLDPNGDDDFFNANGTFAYRTKTGTSIKVLTKDGIKSFSDLPLTGPNQKAAANIVAHYANQTQFPNGYTFFISTGVSKDKTIAFTDDKGTGIAAKGGLSESLNDYNDLVSTLVHEYYHYKNGDPTKGNYTYTDHLKVYDQQMDDKTFAATTNDYKFDNAVRYGSYLLGSHNSGEINDDEFNSKVVEFNKKYTKKYGIGLVEVPGSGDTQLYAVGKNNKNQKKEGNDFIKPATNPH